MTRMFWRCRRVLVPLLLCGASTGCDSSDDQHSQPSSPVAPLTSEEVAASSDAKPSKTDASTVIANAGNNEPLPLAQPQQPTPTEVVPAELAGLAGDVRSAAMALTKLGGDVEVGVGEKVISVDLDGKAVADEQLALLIPLVDLKSLNLSNTAITDAGLERLVTLKKLKFLYLFGTRVTDAGMVSVVALPRLEVVCLDQTEITDSGLKTLEDLPRLEKLHVHSKAKITDAGLESLKKHTRLFELRIGGPHLTEKAIDALRAALPDCLVVYDPETEAKPE